MKLVKRSVGALLCAALLCAAAPAASAEGTFTPVLRFVACSDSHVRSENNRTFDRIGAMLEQAYALADGDVSYPRLDALLMAGDLTNQGTEEEFGKYWTAVSSAKRDDTRLLAVVAKNHDGWSMSRKDMRACFSGLTGASPDFHEVVCGFHFIGLSASEDEGSHYSREQLSWLREQLDEAVADTPGKPVFFTHHEHNRNTVYGSSTYDGWGVKFFGKILKNYPQAVDFSGHSHYPLNDPRSIWQKEYTAIGTGALAYAEFTIDDDRAYDPPDCDEAGTYWIVEVNEEGDLRLRGMDADAGKPLCEYTLANPADPVNRPFDQKKMKAASAAPVFPAGAEIDVEESGKGEISVAAPPAAPTDGFPVTLYRVVVRNNLGFTVEEQWYLPHYYVADREEETIPFTVGGLAKGDYTVSVSAETAYGVQSDPLEKNITVEDGANGVAAFFRLLGRPFRLLFSALKHVF